MILGDHAGTFFIQIAAFGSYDFAFDAAPRGQKTKCLTVVDESISNDLRPRELVKWLAILGLGYATCLRPCLGDAETNPLWARHDHADF